MACCLWCRFNTSGQRGEGNLGRKKERGGSRKGERVAESQS
ncbi:hypothetical protein PVAP13_6NG179203 [Panicum virgatum]|uniref:Uncharacterized protein n=1 Tax=Panicum virgatum TaxID=38727 RepID=A0A8T0QWH2_PANVG|nr:hypothetical protein PVAP13_6NG179203 [Panicum virgatum]